MICGDAATIYQERLVKNRRLPDVPNAGLLFA